MKLETEWTDDCHGKKDYDADLVRLSTRYWPRGGGLSTFDTSTRIWADNEARPGVKPSATASILLQEETVSTADFEAETEAELKALVEKWAQEQFNKIEQAIRAAFPAREKTPDEEMGMKWWNAMSEPERVEVLRQAHEIIPNPSAADAWKLWRTNRIRMEPLNSALCEGAKGDDEKHK